MLPTSPTALRRDESGQGLVQYALIIALVVLTAITGIDKLAKKVNSAFSHVGSVFGGHVEK